MDVVDADVLILGGGNAGLRAAIEARRFRNLKVVIASKSLIPGGSSIMSGGHWNATGFSPVQGPFKDLFDDTIRLGNYLNDQRLVRIALEGAAKELKRVERFGGMWPREGKPDQYLIERFWFAKRSHRYPVHNWYSWQVAHSLCEEAIKLEVILYPEVMITSLQTCNDAVVGATGVDIKSGAFVVFRAKSTILATGGLNQVYKFFSCEKSATGDGFAMALRVGAELINMEFLQWAARQNLMPPELAGRGGAMVNFWSLKPKYFRKIKILNALGERFMEKYDPKWMEFTDRNQFVRAAFNEISQGRGTKNGGIWVDFSELPKEENARWKREELNPQAIDRLREVFTEKQIDWDEPIEVAPAALHAAGGVKINVWGETNVAGFYAVGEVSGGMHGAERLGGNCNAAEALVMGRRTGEAAAKRALKTDEPRMDWTRVEDDRQRVFAPLERQDGTQPFTVKRRIQDVMYYKVGIIRNEEGVTEALGELQQLKREALCRLYVADKHHRYNVEWITALEVLNMLDTAEAITRAALFRTESRAGHYRKDYPRMDNEHWCVQTGIRLVHGEIQAYKKPVEFTYLKLGDVGWSEGEDLHTSWWLPIRFPKGIPQSLNGEEETR